MNGKENIIGRILNAADNKAEYLVEEATTRAAAAKTAAQDSVAADKAALDNRLQNLREERIRNALANAKLDARKYKLAGKQRLISLCYDSALVSLRNMSAEQTAQLIAKLLATYAEDGEIVNFAAKDSGVVTQALLDRSGKKLTLGQAIDIDGGVVLAGNGYDKDLTLVKLVEYVRDKTEADVAAALFGGNNV